MAPAIYIYITNLLSVPKTIKSYLLAGIVLTKRGSLRRSDNWPPEPRIRALFIVPINLQVRGVSFLSVIVMSVILIELEQIEQVANAGLFVGTYGLLTDDLGLGRLSRLRR